MSQHNSGTASRNQSEKQPRGLKSSLFRNAKQPGFNSPAPLQLLGICRGGLWGGVGGGYLKSHLLSKWTRTREIHAKNADNHKKTSECAEKRIISWHSERATPARVSSTARNTSWWDKWWVEGGRTARPCLFRACSTYPVQRVNKVVVVSVSLSSGGIHGRASTLA
jgi:hypothetical protein